MEAIPIIFVPDVNRIVTSYEQSNADIVGFLPCSPSRKDKSFPSRYTKTSSSPSVVAVSEKRPWVLHSNRFFPVIFPNSSRTSIIFHVVSGGALDGAMRRISSSSSLSIGYPLNTSPSDARTKVMVLFARFSSVIFPTNSRPSVLSQVRFSVGIFNGDGSL